MESDKDKINNLINSEQNNKPEEVDFDIISIIQKDKNFIFIHQKIKKLTAAVYMITNFFDESEPLKWSLRKLSASLLKWNIFLQSNEVYGGEKAKSKIQDRILEIISLIEVASFAGLVSPMNLSVLKRESRDLVDRMNKTMHVPEYSRTRMDKEFFLVKEHTDDVIKNYKKVPPAFPDAITNSIKDKDIVLYDQAEGEDTESSSSSIDQTVSRSKLKSFSPVAVKKNKRQSAIIALLKRKKEIMIKDVSAIISDCSEKTIQRELISLVEAGILKKEGKRRWTQYSLAK